MRKLATINIYVGEDSQFGQSTSFSLDEGKTWRVEIDMSDERFETLSRGLSVSDSELFEGTLVHELGHIVQKLAKTEPKRKVPAESHAWALGSKMGHVNPEVVEAAVGSYKD